MKLFSFDSLISNTLMLGIISYGLYYLIFYYLFEKIISFCKVKVLKFDCYVLLFSSNSGSKNI